MFSLEKEFLSTAKKYPKIIIYGAGSVGSLIGKYLKAKGLTEKIIGYAVTNKDENAKTVEGYSVYCIDYFVEHRTDALIVIAVTEQYQAAIADHIKELGFSNSTIVNQTLYNYLNVNIRTNVEKSIFFCEGYYHLMISLVKTLAEKRHTDIVLTNGLDRNIELIHRLKKSTIIGNVFCFNKGSVNEYVSDSHFLLRYCGFKKNVEFFEKEFTLDLSRYKGGVFLFFDDNKIGRYMQSKQIKYILMEDCYEFMNLIMPEKYRAETQKWSSTLYRLNRWLGWGYFPFGQSRYCIEVNVNSELKNNFYKTGKVKISDRKSMFEKITPKDKERLYLAFVECDDLIKNINPENNVLLVTQPICMDGFASSFDVQAKTYLSIVDTMCKNKKVYIKPHPRDGFDYNSILPEAIVLDKNIPTEVFNFLNRILFDKAITLNSTAVYNMDFAREKQLLGLDFIKQFEN